MSRSASSLSKLRKEAESFTLVCASKIKQALQQIQFPETPKQLYSPLRYTLLHSGKQLRPLLTLLSYGLFREDVRSILRPALAVEFFHNFTLMHDDVMDDAPLRRGQPSVHAHWNTNVAILAGDAMLIKGYELLCEVPSQYLLEVLRMFSRSALRVCEGQQIDMDFESLEQVSEDDYFHMIRLKTGCLLGFCLVLGAVVAGADKEQLSTLQDLGEQLGLFFQLKDDLLDVYGKSETFGKRAGGDIVSNKKTFLLIKALQKAKNDDQRELQQWLAVKDFQEKEKIAKIKALYDKLQVRQEVEQKIQDFYNSSCLKIAQLQAPAVRREALLLLLQHLAFRSK